jgi:hypothetical protein
LLIPPSFVGLFNRRLTTNDFPSENSFPQEPFQFHSNEDNRQRPVSVITLSSDEDDEQPPPRFHFFLSLYVYIYIFNLF